ANLEGARLYRANLDGAHLFGANLKDSNLYYASLADANVRSTTLTGANLLGARLSGARFDGSELGKHSIVVNEHKANREAQQGDHVEARKYWLEAEEVYLTLLNNFRDAGRNEEASDMFYRMMVVKRKLMPRFSVGRFGSWFMDIVCGYGERPMRIVSSCLGFVLLYAVLYFLLGIKNAATGDAVVFSSAASLFENVFDFACCFYFSMVIITTTGYGDFLPVDSTRWFAATEAFLGSFFMAVFILVFTRKMMR
ncbi:MAG: pentapeptide repeat-containing protein, partial [FCB group bacterium]|nr:pentapeptide repeat-containing protein [FCB group bacterium]